MNLIKKVLLFTTLIAGVNAADNQCAFQAGSGFEITLATGFSLMTNTTTLSGYTPLDAKKLAFANIAAVPVGGGGGAFTAANGTVFYSNDSLHYGSLKQGNTNVGWTGMFKLAGKFGLGNNMFARIGAFIGYNGTFSKCDMNVDRSIIAVNPVAGAVPGASIPDTNINNSEVITFLNGANLLPSPAPDYSPKSIATMPLCLKSGMGYGILAGIGLEQAWGSIAFEAGVVFRSFNFYFPSATGVAKTDAANIVSPDGVNALYAAGNQITKDTNVYSNFRQSKTLVGARLGFDVSFKVSENMALGFMTAVELYGHRDIVINPNISSAVANVAGTAVAGQAAPTAEEKKTDKKTSGTQNAKNITKLSSNQTITARVKPVVTEFLVSLTYCFNMNR